MQNFLFVLDIKFMNDEINLLGHKSSLTEILFISNQNFTKLLFWLDMKCKSQPMRMQYF